MEKIIIADDDKAIAMLISEALMDEGFETILVYDGNSVIDTIQQNPDVSLIILDVMMPNTDGFQICRKIRDKISCPIVFVTAKNRTLDTLMGLELGGDDYITKPFVVEELVARIKSHIRREWRKSAGGGNIAKIGEIEIHKDSYEVYLSGNRVDLSTREFQVLTYLFENAGIVLSKEQIFNAVWGENYGDMGTVTVQIKNLRDKLDPNHDYIKTVWGIGYKLVKSKDV